MSLKNTKNSSKTSSARKSSTSKIPGGFVKVATESNITEYTLTSNGLTVLCVRIPGSPTVTTNIVYTVGSQHEKTGETGLAHMLEHMLFKQTSGTGPKWKDLENKGANLNATTWLDRTLYYFNMPREYLGDMLAVEADRMKNVLLTEKEFSPERMNVLSEYEMYNSRPEMALEWHVAASAFESHGYHHETIGFKSDIEAYTLELLQSFYTAHYWPDNATLIVAGDIVDADVLTLVKKFFGPISGKPKTNVTTHTLRTEEKQEGVRRVALVRDTPLRFITISFKAPSFSSPEWIMLQLALMKLTDGESSPLYKALVDAGYATSIGASLYPTKDPFLASIQVFATENTSYSIIEEIVFREIALLAKKGITANELSLLKESLLSSTLLSRDGSMHVSEELAEYVATGDWKRYITSLNDIRAITPKNVISAVKGYLLLSQATIGTLHTKETSL